MSHRTRNRAAWGIAGTLLLAIGTQAIADASYRFVQIQNGRVHPRVLRIRAGEPLGWVNYSSKIARVSFERDVGKRLVCDTRTSFSLTGERLESQDIQARQFASMCRLAPGEYAYRVDLRNGAGGMGSGAVSRRLEGRVIVE
jgi:hypothetical protein